MSTGRITSEYKLLYVKSKLFFSLSHDPNVSLVAIIDRVWVRILWRKTIVNREYGDAKFQRPLAGVVLMSA